MTRAQVLWIAAAGLAAACGDDGEMTTTSVGTTPGTTVTTGVDPSEGSEGTTGTSAATTTTVGVTGTSGTTDEPTTGTSAATGSSTGAPCEPLACADDLLGVECAGELVEACADGSYCVDAACTPLAPCEAAELLQGSEGCEFWAVKTEISLSGSCFAAFIANTTTPPPEPPQTRRCPRSPRISAVWREAHLPQRSCLISDLPDHLATARQPSECAWAPSQANARKARGPPRWSAAPSRGLSASLSAGPRPHQGRRLRPRPARLLPE